MRVVSLLIFTFVLTLFAANEFSDFDMNKVRKERGESALVVDSTLATESSAAPSPFILVIRIVGSLFIIAVFIFGIVFGIKKSGILKKKSEVIAGSFELLERFQTSKQGNAILLVRFNKSVLLLGQTSENISLLKTIEGTEAEEIVEDKREGVTVSGFQQSLNNFITTMKGEGPNA